MTARDIFGAPQEPGRVGTWIQTFTGRKFWPLDPRPGEVDILDIAHGLSQVCRYGGHTRRFYSVAEHSVIVSQYVPAQYARAALLHDASEAYLGDMVRPLKHDPRMAPFRAAEAALEHVVRERFDLLGSEDEHAAIKAIDDRIIGDEVLALMSSPPDYWIRHQGEPLGATITGLRPTHAEHVFLTRFLELWPELAAGIAQARAEADRGWRSALGFDAWRKAGRPER
jgi:hypothetical protein